MEGGQLFEMVAVLLLDMYVVLYEMGGVLFLDLRVFCYMCWVEVYYFYIWKFCVV